MTSWKDKIGKFIVIEANEIESDFIFMASMSRNYSYGVFEILPYREEVFPEVNYKVVLKPIDENKYLKRAHYICDLESSMRPNCFNMDPKTCIFDDVVVANIYAKNLNIYKKNER